MQRRTTAALSLVLLAAATLAGCTSDADSEQESTTTAAPTTEGAAPADPDWFCRLIDSEIVDAATGGRAAEAREVAAVDELNEFRCDVVLPTTGTETEVALSLSIHRNVPGEADARLAEVKALEGATPGPEQLGVSYIANTLAVSVVPCKDLAATGQAQEEMAEVPYVFTLRTQLDTEGAANALTHKPLTRMVREMDQSVGCSPSKIHEPDDAATTQAPADDSAVTTAP